jgi:hypothetical protein
MAKKAMPAHRFIGFIHPYARGASVENKVFARSNAAISRKGVPGGLHFLAADFQISACLVVMPACQ